MNAVGSHNFSGAVRAGCVLAWGAAVGVMLAGCTYERVVNYKPFFTGLDGATHRTEPVKDQSQNPGLAGAGDPRIVIENPDGSVTLLSRSGRHLMTHILRTLREEEPHLFVEQLLSDRTRIEYEERGLDPMEAYKTLKTHEREVQILFARMPFGEQSPNVIMEKIDTKMYRVRLTGRATRDLQWTFMDMVLEHGQWKLRWLGPVAEPKPREPVRRR